MRPTVPGLPTLRGKRVLLRPASPDDVAALQGILDSPEVAAWWGDTSEADLEEQLTGSDVHTLVVEFDGRVAGMIQYHEEDEPMYRSAGMDIAMAPGQQDRGLGTDAVRTLARHLLVALGHHRLTIDPAAANARAIAVYRKVGFRPVGVMRQYERGRDGTWHDGLLMDLLREEFVE